MEVMGWVSYGEKRCSGGGEGSLEQIWGDIYIQDIGERR